MDGLAALEARFAELVAQANAEGAHIDPGRLAQLRARLETERATLAELRSRLHYSTARPMASEVGAASQAVEATLRELAEAEAAQDPGAVTPLLNVARDEVVTPAARLLERAMLDTLAATVASDLSHAAQVATVCAAMPADALEAFLRGAIDGGRRRDAAMALLSWLEDRGQTIDAEFFVRGWMRAVAAFFLGETPLRALERMVRGESELRQLAKAGARHTPRTADDFRLDRPTF